MTINVTFEDIGVAPSAISPSVVAVLGDGATVPAGQTQVALNTPMQVGSFVEAQNNFGTTGSLQQFCSAVFAQGGARVVGIRYDSTLTGTNLQTAITNGINRMEDIETLLGVKPDFLCAPGLTHVVTGGAVVGDSAPNVATLEAVAANLDAIVPVAVPAATQAVLNTWLGNNHSSRVRPYWIQSVTRGGTAVDGTGSVVGAMLRSDRENGIQRAPSLITVRGVSDYAPKPTYNPTNPSALAFTISNLGSGMLVRRRGNIRLFGGKLGVADTSPFRFMPVRRIADLVGERFEQVAEEILGRNPTGDIVGRIEDQMNSLLSTYVAQQIIVAGSCVADAMANTPSELAQGNLHYDIDLTCYAPIGQVNAQIQVQTGG